MGISTFLRTDIWLVAHLGVRDIPSIPHRNYKMIQLWHAVGSKAVGVVKRHFEKYDIWCVSSDFIKQRCIDLRGAPHERLYVSGFARIDTLLNYLRRPRKELLRTIGIENGKKIVLYTPTYEVGIWPYENAYEEFERLCNFCKKK